ncbi:MAG TPA: hypothetical protein VHZ51_16185 [Ktedonobacteraceae bacterium]|jgi:hypothetical protein|nr:hypothetical protein [Ktedonobacteraceae bacterium]
MSSAINSKRSALDVGGVPVPLQFDANDAARRSKLRHYLPHCLNGHETAGKQEQRFPAPVYLVVEVQTVDRGVAFLLVLVCGHVFSPSFVTSRFFVMCSEYTVLFSKQYAKAERHAARV